MDFALLIQELFSGLFYMMSGDGFKTLIMFIIAGVLIALAIVLIVTSIRNKRGSSGLPAALGLNYFREDR